MTRIKGVLLGVLIIIILISCVRVIDLNKNNLHEDQWEKVAKMSKEIPEYKYAIYFSRSMAVKYPELYLRADKKFLTTRMYFKNEAYENDSKDYYRQRIFFRTLDIPEVNEDYDYNFSIENVKISDFTKGSYESIYKSKDYIKILDTVLFPLCSSLKANNKEIPSVNLAEIIYFKEKAKGKNVYILCDEEFNAYVFVDGKIIDDLGNEVKDEKQFILIFSEDFAWYPLMERDDTNKNEELKEIVEIYGQTKMPKIGMFEKEIIKILKNSTDIEDEIEKKKIVNYASRDYKLTDMIFFNHSEARKKLNEYEIDELMESNIYDKKNDYINILAVAVDYSNICEISNRISPSTAKYAKKLREYSKSEKDISNNLREVINDFKIDTNKINAKRLELDLWYGPDYFVFNLNDLMLTSGLTCWNSAMAMNSIIELAYDDIYVEQVWTYLVDIGTHINLSIEHEDKRIRFENFHISEGKDGYDLSDEVILRGVIKDNKWVIFENSDDKSEEIYTNANMGWVKKVLNNIPNKENGQVLIERFNYTPNPIKTCTINEFIKQIDEGNIENFIVK